MTAWTRIDSTEGEIRELPARASMRAIKASLGITGRRIVLEAQAGAWRQYRLIGTAYRFIVSDCN